jgi:GNAT superfamily N-acetyltransferase
MTVKLIRFKEEHAPRVGEIFRSAFAPYAKSNGGVYPDELVRDWMNWSMDPKVIIKEFKDERVKLLLAQIDGRIVGTFGYAPGSMEGRLDFAKIRWVLVTPEFQGFGVGKRLHDASMEEIWKEGYLRQYVYVAPLAHGFYEKMGWAHNPEFDVFSEKYPYDPVLQERINALCQHVGRGIQKPLTGFFFEKRES